MASKSNVRFYLGLIIAALLVCSTAAFAQFSARFPRLYSTAGIVDSRSAPGMI